MDTDRFQEKIEDLNSKAEDVSPTLPEGTAPVRKRADRYWPAAMAGGLLLVVLEAAVLLSAEIEEAPAPPPEVVAAFEQNACAKRMTAIMEAINLYARENGEPPQRLDQLFPRHLTGRPVDPDSGRPYLYRRIGQSTLVECPNPESHASDHGRVVR